jgi:hypothetical protein
MDLGCLPRISNQDGNGVAAGDLNPARFIAGIPQDCTAAAGVFGFWFLVPDAAGIKAGSPGVLESAGGEAIGWSEIACRKRLEGQGQ